MTRFNPFHSPRRDSEQDLHTDPPQPPQVEVLANPRTAARMATEWARDEFFSQAATRLSRYLGVLCTDGGPSEVLGGWSGTWGDPEVVWYKSGARTQNYKTSSDHALERLQAIHGQAFDKALKTVVTVHIRSPQTLKGDFLVNDDLTNVTSMLELFSRGHPVGFPGPEQMRPHVTPQPCDLQALRPLIEFATDAKRIQHFRIGLDVSVADIADAGSTRVSDVTTTRALLPCLGGSEWQLLQALVGRLNGDESALVVTVAALSPMCEPWWVIEEKTKALADATREMLQEIDLRNADGPESAIPQLHSAWHTVRNEMKAKLEELIESLSERTFETFEEKVQIAARLNEMLDAWRFRAISPSTGRAAYFQCRAAQRNPLGFFLFQDVDPSLPPVGPANPGAPRASVKIPTFRLTDAPPDARVRRSSQTPDGDKNP